MSPASAQEDARALDPSDVFFQAWLEIQRAEKLEKSGVTCMGENVATGLQLVNKALKANNPY